MTESHPVNHIYYIMINMFSLDFQGKRPSRRLVQLNNRLGRQLMAYDVALFCWNCVAKWTLHLLWWCRGHVKQLLTLVCSTQLKHFEDPRRCLVRSQGMKTFLHQLVDHWCLVLLDWLPLVCQSLNSLCENLLDQHSSTNMSRTQRPPTSCEQAIKNPG